MQTPKNAVVKVLFERQMGMCDLLNDPISKAYKQKLRAEVNQIFHLDERFQKPHIRRAILQPDMGYSG